MRFAAVFLIAFACSGALASEPGSPIDCSDWVLVEPGLTCLPWEPFPCPEDGDFCHRGGASTTFDNEGRLLSIRFNYLPDPSCVRGSRIRMSVVFRDGTSEGLLAYVDDRCSPGVQDGTWDSYADNLAFDAQGGRLLVRYNANQTISGPPNYNSGPATVAIHGFASTFEILQSYGPQPAALGFRVPYMPEGMAGADSFDTYWGPLTKPLDFTQAHPLQCNYPDAQPHIGDYLTVPDTVPTPSPGQGVYYVTSATYQGATRYGRKTRNGHLTGRDPALLPSCVP